MNIITGKVQGLYNTTLNGQSIFVAAENETEAARVRAGWEWQNRGQYCEPEAVLLVADKCGKVGDKAVVTFEGFWLGESESLTVTVGPVSALDNVE